VAAEVAVATEEGVVAGVEPVVVVVGWGRRSLAACMVALAAAEGLGGLVYLRKLKDRRAHAAVEAVVAVAVVCVDPADSHQMFCHFAPCSFLIESFHTLGQEQKPCPWQL